jgi:Cu+-exporting ATPase
MNTTEVNFDLKCSHCGEDCPDDTIYSDDLFFCCNGCKTVYDLLSENGLSSYYSQSDFIPGISMKSKEVSSQYNFLDSPDIQQNVLDFKKGSLATVTFRTPQIHCAACIWLLENLHKLDTAVTFSQVSFSKREVSIRFDIEKLPLSELVGLLSKIGYKPDLNIDKIDIPKSKNVNRSLYLKIGIAGFAFGNIMLFSLPDYLAGAAGLDSQFQKLFGSLNIALALPVFFYSSLDFFIPAWNSVRSKYWSMDIAISLGIIAMFFRSLYEIYMGTSIGYMDSFTMLVFLLLVGRLFQRKTFDQLSFERDYKSYFPLAVIRLIEGREESVAATNLTEGDIVLIRHNELLPADAKLLDEEATLDFSFVTGESDPVKITKSESCYAGGRNVGTSVRFQVEKSVSGSYLTKLWNHSVFDKSVEPSLGSVSQRFSRYFSPAVLLIALLSGLYWYPIDIGISINAFTAVLIVACPCALALSAPFSLGWSTNLLARRKFYLKNGEISEKMASIDTIVFDKTGTLTHRKDGDVNLISRELNTKEIAILKSLLYENTHPYGRQVYKYLDQNWPDTPYYTVEDYSEVTGKGVYARINGESVYAGSAGWVNAIEYNESKNGYPRLYFKLNDEIAGFFEIKTTFRSGVKELVHNLSSKYNLFVLSGDNSRDSVRLSNIFQADQLYFKHSPDEKLDFIEKLKKGNHQVLMIGDGLNDAGALKASTIGLSIADDTSSFTPASDVIMDAETLPDLHKILSFSKSTVRIIYISFAISVLYNIVGLAFAVTGTLSPIICAIIMPVSSVTVIAFTTLATHWSAWKKGVI